MVEEAAAPEPVPEVSDEGEPEPMVEDAAAPEPVPEVPAEGEPEPDAASETIDVDSGDAALTPDADDEETDAEAEPTVETAEENAMDAGAAPELEAAPDLGAAPELEPRPEPELDVAPEPEPESESEPEADIDLAPNPEPEPTTSAGPPSSPAPFNAWRDEPMLTHAPGPIRRSPIRTEIDSHGLARLALLDAVDDTWPGGTPDLSAWLAANLELLEDPLGFSLVPRHPVPLAPERQLSDSYEMEQSPLDFPGNVVTADGSGATVMVRAQVGVADPEGLGALLAAAAASEAQTAVWVCPRIDEGFRQALRWVGGDPSANVRLYGLEMYLVRINDSSTAPLFDAVVAPGAP
ncbi:MAG TPA: hypothetical protein VEX15_09810 [Nocardioidaceae bacterium]|nr:hypothetical protein [Nocardioidaceae bacterium]